MADQKKATKFDEKNNEERIQILRAELRLVRKELAGITNWVQRLMVHTHGKDEKMLIPGTHLDHVNRVNSKDPLE